MKCTYCGSTCECHGGLCPDCRLPKQAPLTLQALWDALDKHDWHYDFSDDGDVYRRGQRVSAALRTAAASLEGGEAMYSGFRSYVSTGPNWKSRQEPKPKRPE